MIKAYRFWSIKFGAFAAVGLAMMLGASLTNGILIDWAGGPPELIAPAVILFFFLLKYYVYVVLKIIEPRFARYLLTNSALTLLSLWLVPLLILNSPLSASVSTVAVMTAMVGFRFLVFRSVKLIKTPDQPNSQ